ncbi:putative hNH endonuclease [Mycobacterium kansasii 732]|nr:putative hNH endonuclease [Mycobacterium kansasii 732]
MPAHHIRHWKDSGATELANLVLLYPYRHRGVMTGASSPSPDPQSISPSPTTPDDRCAQDRSRVRPTFPCRRAVPRAHRRAPRLVMVRTISPPPPPTTNQVGQQHRIEA